MQRLILPVLPALVGVGIVLYACQKYGIGLVSDSVGYIRAAREILAGQGVPDWFNLQPPLYPVALALAGLVSGSDPLAAAVWLNALVFGGVIWLAGGLLLRQFAHTPVLAAAGMVCVLCARPLINVALYGYSELVFILFVLGTLWALELYFERGAWEWLAASLVCSALACLTRYVGVAVVATAALALVWWGWRAGTPGERVRGAVTTGVFTAASLLPLALWLVRNGIVSGYFWGERAPSRIPLGQNINLAQGTIANWFVPDVWQSLLWLGILVGVVVSGVLYLRRRSVGGDVTVALLPMLMFGVLFLLLLLGSATTTAYNRLNSRLLSPLFFPVLVMLLLVVGQIASLPARLNRRLYAPAALALVALFGVFPIQALGTRLQNAAQDGAGGYNTVRWRTSETVAYSVVHSGEWSGTIYSNGGDVLYILGNVQAESIPSKTLYASNVRTNKAEALAGVFPPEPATLVWFKNIARDDFLFTVDELAQFTNLHLVATFKDGKIYRMEKLAR